MHKAAVVTSDNKWGDLCTDTPDNLGPQCAGHNWGNQCTREVQSYVGPMKNVLTIVRLSRLHRQQLHFTNADQRLTFLKMVEVVDVVAT